MVEHTEIFWSLYSVDMDAALSSQPPDTWDSFALFQMLNNYLRMERKYKVLCYYLLSRRFITHFAMLPAIMVDL